jgi:peroxiredoxin
MRHLEVVMIRLGALGFVVTLSATMLAQTAVDPSTLGPMVGDKAIAFTLPDQNGTARELAALAGPQGTMLVFFRSSDWWPYCRTQLVELQRNLGSIRQQGYGLVAVSYDSVETLKTFADKHAITFPLLSDQGSKTIAAWGILNRSATGRAAGVPHPGTFIVDERGVIRSRFFEREYQERSTAASVLTRVGLNAGGEVREIAAAQATFRLSASDSTVAPGQRLTLRIDVTPGPRMHIYAPGQQGYIPIALTLDATPDVRIAHPISYPAPGTYYFAPLKETVKVYEQPFRLLQDVTLALTPALRKRATAGETLRLSGSLEYQACDDKVCYRPQTLPVEWSMRLVPIGR